MYTIDSLHGLALSYGMSILVLVLEVHVKMYLYAVTSTEYRKGDCP